MRVPHLTGNSPNTASNNTTRPEQQKWRPHKPQERHIRSNMMVERKPGGAFMSRSRSIFAYQLGPFKTPVVDAGWLQELADIAILEYQACARKVALAANIWDYCIHQNVLVGDHVTDAGKVKDVVDVAERRIVRLHFPEIAHLDRKRGVRALVL
mgnify:CR=1 FL=1